MNVFRIVLYLVLSIYHYLNNDYRMLVCVEFQHIFYYLRCWLLYRDIRKVFISSLSFIFIQSIVERFHLRDFHPLRIDSSRTSIVDFHHPLRE